MREYFTYVVIDSPPALEISDAMILSPAVDGVILVARAGKTPRKAVGRAAAQIMAVGGTLLGVLLNGADLDQPGYGYYYGYVRRLLRPLFRRQVQEDRVSEEARCPSLWGVCRVPALARQGALGEEPGEAGRAQGLPLRGLPQPDSAPLAARGPDAGRRRPAAGRGHRRRSSRSSDTDEFDELIREISAAERRNRSPEAGAAMSRIASDSGCGAAHRPGRAGRRLAAGYARRTSRPGEDSGQLSIVSQPGVEVVWEGVVPGQNRHRRTAGDRGHPARGATSCSLLQGGLPATGLAGRDRAGPAVRARLRPGSLRPAPHEPAWRRRRRRRRSGGGNRTAGSRPGRGKASSPAGSAPPGHEPERATAGGFADLTAQHEFGNSLDRGSLDHASARAARAGPAEAAAQDSRSSRQDGALPPVVYLLGFGLLTATGAVALRRRRRLAPRRRCPCAH